MIDFVDPLAPPFTLGPRRPRCKSHLACHARAVPMVIDGEEYVDRAELATYLDVEPDTISSWTSRGTMPQPARYVGRSPLWLLSEIDAWNAERPGKGWRSNPNG
jgi:predicted DNA-binding transcriptional regulator AlpA